MSYSSVYTRVPGAMNRSISGRIVTCRTFSSIWITTAPRPLDHPENRRLFAVQGAAPACPFSRRRRPRRPFFTASGCPCDRYDVDFVALHFPDQDRFGLAGDDPVLQLLGHALNVIRVQPQRLGNLGIRGSSP